MSQQGNIETIVRGVCIKDEKLLLCHTKGARNTYLPGGHIDFGEGAREALKREIGEELGCDCKAGRFLGVVENCYLRDGEKFCEVNLLFELDISELDPRAPAISKEDYIEFQWQSIDQLREVALEPAVLCDLLPVWLEGGDSGFGSSF